MYDYCFRQARELLKVIKSDYFNDLTDVVIDGKQLDPPKNLEWSVFDSLHSLKNLVFLPGTYSVFPLAMILLIL